MRTSQKARLSFIFLDSNPEKIQTRGKTFIISFRPIIFVCSANRSRSVFHNLALLKAYIKISYRGPAAYPQLPGI